MLRTICDIAIHPHLMWPEVGFQENETLWVPPNWPSFVVPEPLQAGAVYLLTQDFGHVFVRDWTDLPLRGGWEELNMAAFIADLPDAVIVRLGKFRPIGG